MLARPRASVPPGRRPTRWSLNSKAWPYIFLFPFLAAFAVFWAWPILYSIYLSLLNTRVYPWRWEPGVNWGRILSDPFFWEAVKNTVIILVIQVPLMLVLA